MLLISVLFPVFIKLVISIFISIVDEICSICFYLFDYQICSICNLFYIYLYPFEKSSRSYIFGYLNRCIRKESDGILSNFDLNFCLKFLILD